MMELRIARYPLSLVGVNAADGLIWSEAKGSKGVMSRCVLQFRDEAVYGNDWQDVPVVIIDKEAE